MIKYNLKLEFYSHRSRKGIGKATLDLLYNSGANIAVITRSEVDIKKIQRSYQTRKIITYTGDVSNQNDIKIF